jgi:8-hydroxy-5-deazaflavin:NADPH oxidoreductase
VNPSIVSGDHDAFVSGNDEKAKAAVVDIMENWYGWKTVIDLGDITTARGTEQLMPIWIRLWTVYGDANFNFKIVRDRTKIT